MAAPVEVTSPKGIRAWLVEDQSLPMVALHFVWRRGSEQDPVQQEGLSYLAANLLSQGAAGDKANDVEKKLQDNALILNFGAQRDAIYGQFRSLKETLPQGLDLLHNAIQSPRFDDDVLVREKEKTHALRNSYLADPDWLLSRMMISVIFANHQYVKPTLGSEKSINALTKIQLKEWQKNTIHT
jgi:zinc protease